METTYKKISVHCTYCGYEEVIEHNGIDEAYECEACGRSIVINNAQKFAEKNLIEDNRELIKNLRERLEDAVRLDGLEEIKECAHDILQLIPNDYTSRYYYAYAINKEGTNNNYIREFYRAPVRNATPDNVREVVDHIIAYSELRDYEIIEAYIKVNATGLLSLYKSEFEKRKKKYLGDTAKIERDVFVCHSSKDRSVVKCVVETLEKSGYTCWVSYRNMDKNTSNYKEFIKDNIKLCKIFLVVSSGEAQISNDVQWEIENARNLNKSRVEFKIDNEEHSPLFDDFFNKLGLSWVEGVGCTRQQLKNLCKRVFEVKENPDEYRRQESKQQQKSKEIVVAGNNANIPYEPVKPKKSAARVVATLSILLVIAAVAFVGVYSGIITLPWGNDPYNPDNGGGNTPVYSDGLEFKSSEDGSYCILVGIGTCTDRYITIPSECNSIPVKVIGSGAFRNCTDIVGVTIPAGITEIGWATFEGCSALESIIIPFVGHSKTDMENTHFGYIFGASYSSDNGEYIPETLKYVKIAGRSVIHQLAFEDCGNITTIELSDKSESVGLSAFKGCSSLESITISFVGNVKDGTENTHFGYIFGASSYNDNVRNVPASLKSVNIIGVCKIAEYAFYGCSGLTDVVISDNVTEIGKSAFEGCDGLTSMTIPFVGNVKDGSENTHFGYIFGAGYESWLYGQYPNNGEFVPKSLKSVRITGDIEIVDYMFFLCSSLTSIEFLYSFTQIGEFAFLGCSSLVSIDIPNSVNTIGQYAFENCQSLTSIEISGVSVIEKGVFEGCKGLTNVVVGDGIKTIKDTAFSNCSNLTDLTIHKSVTSIETNAFSNCGGLVNIYYTGTIVDWCSITLGNLSPTHYAKNLYIDNELIEGKLIIPDTVQKIKAYTFYNRTSLTSITIPDSVTTIGAGAFRACSGLTSITIPDSVTTMGFGAFEGCSSLASISIPFVGSNKDGSYNTSFVWIFGGEYWDIDSYKVPTSLKTVTITGGVAIGNSAFCDCYNLINVIISGNIKEIGSCAFENCSSLGSVVLGNSIISSIGENAFGYCIGLKSIELPVTLNSIRDRAFLGCSALTTITYKGTKSQWASVLKGYNWLFNTKVKFIKCTDGDVAV